MEWGKLAGDVLPSVIGAVGQERTNRMNKGLMKDSWAFQKYMSDTSYQRAAKDLKKAGINPILAGQFGGASTPASALATMRNPMEGASVGATTAKTVQDTKQSEHKTAIAKAEAVLKNNLIAASKLAKVTAQAALDLITSSTKGADIKATVNIIQQLSKKAGGDMYTWYHALNQTIDKMNLPKQKAKHARQILKSAIHSGANIAPQQTLRRK